jgi:hypothetical protein
MTPFLSFKGGELEKATAVDMFHQNEVWQGGPLVWRGVPSPVTHRSIFHHTLSV